MSGTAVCFKCWVAKFVKPLFEHIVKVKRNYRQQLNMRKTGSVQSRMDQQNIFVIVLITNQS